MARNNGIIPRNAQVPVALALAFALVGLLTLRAVKNEESGARVLAANQDVQDGAGVVVAYERVPTDDLRNLIRDFGSEASGVSKSPPQAPPLARNPFLIPEGALAKIMDGEQDGAGEYGEESYTDYSGAREMNSMVLTGTSKIGETYMAIVNGMVLAEGDRINGFTIVKVDEGVLVLKNNRGTRIVRMKERETR